MARVRQLVDQSVPPTYMYMAIYTLVNLPGTFYGGLYGPHAWMCKIWACMYFYLCIYAFLKIFLCKIWACMYFYLCIYALLKIFPGKYPNKNERKWCFNDIAG